MTKILVTGCAGFIGSHLTAYLLNSEEYKNVEVIGLDNLDPYYDIEIKKKNLKLLEKYSNFKFYLEDIRTTKVIEKEILYVVFMV